MTEQRPTHGFFDTSRIHTRHESHTGGELIPVDEPQPPDPYPEHPTHLGGVRQHTHPEPHIDWMVIEHYDNDGPLPVAANTLPSVRDLPGGRRRWPLAALTLYLLGQLVLAVAITAGSIGPTLGIIVCLTWLACGLTLIAAETVGQLGTDDRGGHGDR